MSLADRIERLPIEEWAAFVARNARRTRRRVMRRPASAIGIAAGVVVAVAVGGNALFSQSEPHPAPLWGEAPQEMIAAHGDVRQVAEPEAAAVAEADQALVQRVQEGLAASGYYAGPPDGVLDGATEEAIRAFERESGLPETGAPSLALLAAVAAGGLDAAVAEASAGEAESFAVEEVVIAPDAAARAGEPIGISEVQRLLNERGYGPLSVDGKMGPATRQALGRFSADAGFGADAGMTPAVLDTLAGRRG